MFPLALESSSRLHFARGPKRPPSDVRAPPDMMRVVTGCRRQVALSSVFVVVVAAAVAVVVGVRAAPSRNARDFHYRYYRFFFPSSSIVFSIFSFIARPATSDYFARRHGQFSSVRPRRVTYSALVRLTPPIAFTFVRLSSVASFSGRTTQRRHPRLVALAG